MRVFVAGGTGVLGRRLVPQPLARGHRGTATTTSAAKLNLYLDRWLATTNRLRTEGTDHLPAAAEATGVSRFVAQGHASCNGIREGGWVKTEKDPLDLMTGTAAQAGATVLDVEQKATGVFNIVGDEPAPAREWPPYLAECAGAKKPSLTGS